MDVKELIDGNDLQAIRAVLDGGHSPTRVVGKRTLLHYAVAKGRIEALEIVANKARELGLLEKRHNGRPALWYAVHVARREAVELLLALGADANSFDVEDGVMLPEGTALKLASDRGYLWAVDALLSAGADPNRIEPSDSRSPLETAARFGENRWHDDTHRVEIIEALLAAGADPNLSSAAYGRTALHELAFRKEFGEREERAVQLLVRAGARFDVVDKNGLSPLSMAVDSRCSQAAICFLTQGAAPNAPAHRRRPPLATALRHKLGELVVALVEHGAVVRAGEREAVETFQERHGSAPAKAKTRRPRPVQTDALADGLADCDRLETKTELAELLIEVTEEGDWNDGEEWASLLSKAIELSPTYEEVAEDVYGEPVSMDEDEGPLVDGWFDEGYGLLDAVLAALEASAEDRPPRWGELLLSLSKAAEVRGIRDEDGLEELERLWSKAQAAGS